MDAFGFNIPDAAVSAGASILPAEAQAAMQSLLPQSPQDPLTVSPVVPLAVAVNPPAPVVVPAPKSKTGLYIGLGAAALVGFYLWKKSKKGKK